MYYNSNIQLEMDMEKRAIIPEAEYLGISG